LFTHDHRQRARLIEVVDQPSNAWRRAGLGPGGVACIHLGFLAVMAGVPVPVYIDKARVYSRCAAWPETVDAERLVAQNGKF